MSSNAKLLLGLAAVVLVGAGLFAGVVGGAAVMDHSVPTATAERAQEQPPLAAESAQGGEALLLRADGTNAAEDAIERLTALPGVAGVNRYLSASLSDGTPVVGLDPVTAPLRSPDGTALSSVTTLAGRSLDSAGSGVPVVLAGLAWAESHESVYGYQVAGMIASHAAPVLLDGEEVEVVDVVETGDEQADEALFMPLALAQELLERPGGVSLIHVELTGDADVDAVEQAAAAAGFEVVGR